MKFATARMAPRISCTPDAIGAGHGFDFSKRTNLYASYTRFQNSGTDPGRIGGPILAGLTIPGDTSVSEYVLGIRQSFRP